MCIISSVVINYFVLTLQDLLKCLPESHPDYKSLKCALREFQSFLSDFKMIQPEQLFHVSKSIYYMTFT